MSFREQPDGERLQTDGYEYLPEQPAEQENKTAPDLTTVLFSIVGADGNARYSVWVQESV